MIEQSSNTESKTETFKHIGENADAIANEARGRAAKVFISLNNSARFMWHAYLGSLVTAEETLVNTAIDMAKVGSEFEAKTKKQWSKRVDKLQESTAKLRKRAQQRFDGAEEAFDRGVDRSLHLLGVPTRRDVNQLTGLIQDLSDSVNDLANKTGVTPKPRQTKASSTVTPA